MMEQLVLTSKSISTNILLRKYLQYYSNSPELHFLSILGDLGTFINSIKEINPYIYSIRIYCTDPAIPRYKDIIYQMELVTDEEWYQKVCNLSYNEYLWSDSHVYEQIDFLGIGFELIETTKQEVFSLHRKIYTLENTEVIGILEVNILKDVMANIAMSGNKGIYMYILGQDLEVISRTPNAYDLQIDFTGIEIKDSPKKSTMIIDSTEYVLLHDEIPAINHKIVLIYPYKLITDEARSKLIAFFILGLVGIFIIFFVINFVSRLIFKRMNVLVEYMKKIQEGDFDAKIQIDYMDEVGEIKKAFNMMSEKIKELIETVYKTKLAEKEATLSYLQAQMNPHFLFNSLEAIRMMAEMENDCKVTDALFSLSKVLKTRIKPDVFINIGEEISVIESFVHIENIRFNNKIQLIIDIDDSLRNLQIPALIIQPIVENSIIHGFKYKKDNCIINLIARPDNGRAIILITDNGKGISQEDLELINIRIAEADSNVKKSDSVNGIGLINIHKRIKYYYGDNCGLSISSVKGQGTSVTLNIKLNIPK